MYFTGDSHFNRSMRAFAKQAGLSLSDGGLAVCERKKIGGKVKKIQVGYSVLCDTEEEIFKFFQVNYVEPSKRVCIGTEGRLHSTGVKGGIHSYDNWYCSDDDESDDTSVD